MPYWADLTTREMATLDTAQAIAILPVAAVEQHGPHLPVGTDLAIAEGYVARINARLAGRPVLVLPVQAVGASAEHLSFPGTLSLSPETALAAWGEICAQVHAVGIRRLVILNTHGGNVPVIDILARRLRERHAMLAITASMHRFGYPEGLFTAQERAHGIHGGTIETALMLAFRPDLVRMEEARDFVPFSRAMEERFAVLRANHPVGFGWMSEDLHPSGAMGNAAAATAAMGEAAISHGVEGFLALLEDVARFDMDDFRPAPRS
ncbi:creatininase family protein [Aquabacter cavernae]|uniref:creatininase family protein n=1 Tax=Aquabacter cavernae TaxID=2496029 RepID=UPI000F8CACAF|nr:creatininase family protein [Aquabacter cavernae]